MSQCFVCGKHLKSCDISNDFSREDFAVTVKKIIGDDYLLIFGEEDHLCRACQNLLLRILRLEVEEKNNILAMGVHLQMKYSLDFSNDEDSREEPRPKILESDVETDHCFVCDKLLQNSDIKTDYSRTDLINIIRKIVGDKYCMVIKDDDYLCQDCNDLMSKIQSKGKELRTMTLAMRALLRIKYSLEFHSVGSLGSSLEDSSASTQNRRFVRPEDLSGLSFQRPVNKVCRTKIAVKRNAVKRNAVKFDKSEKYLNSSNITPSTNTCTRKRKKCLGVSSPNTVLDSLCSTQCLVSEEIEIQLKDKKDSYEENLSAAAQNNSQLRIEDSANQNSPTLLQDESHKENCVNESENVSSESKTIISFHKSGHKKCLMHNKVPKPFKCGRCKFKYSSPEELESHNLEMKNKKDLYCKICDFNFHLKNLIQQHKSNHSPTNLYRQCRLCCQPIYDSLHLKYHIYTIHMGEPAHKCSYCSRTFMWKRQLTRHLYQFHEVKPAFVCEKCKKVYADKIKYLKHIEYSHRSSFCCKVCLKSFQNIDTLVSHERAHRQTRFYKCQYCYKRYKTKENRSIHEEQHSGHFKHRCKNCGLGFRELAWLENHKAKNSCSGSLYGYINRQTLCEICGKIYSNRFTFRNHHILHFDPHPFECNVCFKKLRYKQKLTNHKKRFHPETLRPSSTSWYIKTECPDS